MGSHVFVPLSRIVCILACEQGLSDAELPRQPYVFAVMESVPIRGPWSPDPDGGNKNGLRRGRARISCPPPPMSVEEVAVRPSL
jgi:hypothetical protein